MQVRDVSPIIDEYVKWIKDNTSIRSIKGDLATGIVTPFLDRHNDHIEIYITRKEEDSYVLTDDGHTLGDLEMSGFSLSSPKRERLFKSILSGFGVKYGENNELYIEANMSNIGQKKHYLLQAIISVNDMYSLSQESVMQFFKEDVELYFQSQKIIFTKDVKLGGKTGFDHNIDFIIPAYEDKQEKLIRTINRPKKDIVMATIFAFNDIANLREQRSLNYVIYNDTDASVSGDAISALKSYGVRQMAWSQRDPLAEEFSFS